ncbi:MAG: glycosyltransferase family 2 protein [Pirellulales bacterium]|nr:glycosyltransferase family 2 protein [Pirellulales bacterium]
MTSMAAVVVWTGKPSGASALDFLKRCPEIQDVAIVARAETPLPSGPLAVFQVSNPWSSEVVVDVLRWFDQSKAEYLVWILSPSAIVPEAGLKRLADCARDTNASIVYSDYYDRRTNGVLEMHPLIDYQPGSLRDDFDFGPVLLLNGTALTRVVSRIKHDSLATEFGGWYDLRLRLTEEGPVMRLPEPNFTLPLPEKRGGIEEHFSYVDPRNRNYQIEMERIATAHLKRIGAFLSPPQSTLIQEANPFPVEASVVIPVRNRKRTVADAVASALAQQAAFPFNVIVVDNHSSDGTTQILADMACREPRLVHIVPSRLDLGIGGCWNEAIHSEACGRYAVQLDSDDLYHGTDVLTRIVAEFHRADYAMVIGSYTIVDFDLNPIPPGLVDHREWTDENGPNNGLRIAGFGAPRAFHVPTLRSIGFPNVSYGEDYGVVLRITRQYRLGRIYDSLYWCRRWEDNSDHALSLETKNRYALYKDRLRTIEIAARQK